MSNKNESRLSIRPVSGQNQAVDVEKSEPETKPENEDSKKPAEETPAEATPAAPPGGMGNYNVRFLSHPLI
jgi:hypothetical protein